MPTKAPAKKRSTSGGDGRARHVMHRDATEDAAAANPLRAGTRLERVPDPAIVVVFRKVRRLVPRVMRCAPYFGREGGEGGLRDWFPNSQVIHQLRC